MIITDHRSNAQRETHVHLAIGTDPMLTGWGPCKNGNSFAAWAFNSERAAAAVLDLLATRKGLKRMRLVYDPPGNPYRPSPSCGHLSIYPVAPGHWLA